MTRRRGRVGDYFVSWDDSARQFHIKPKNQAGGSATTPKFSLGNADLTLNVEALSGNNKVVKVLTGETSAKKLLPVPALHLPRWEVSVSGSYRRDEIVSGINGTNVRVNWVEASGFSMSLYENKVGISVGGDVYCMWKEDIPSVAGVSDELLPSGSQAAAVPRSGTIYNYGGYLGILNNGSAELWTIGPGNGGDKLSLRKSVSAHPTDDAAYPTEVTAFRYLDLGKCSAPYGSGIRVRFSNGDVCTYDEVAQEYGSETFIGCRNSARITMNNSYKPTGMYYKSGVGDAGVVPFLSDGKGNDFIVSVFEEMSGDTIVIMRESGAYVIFKSGLEYHLDGSKKLIKAFGMWSKSFIILDDGAERVLYEVRPRNIIERIAKCTYAGAIVTWPAENGAPPIQGYGNEIPAENCGAQAYTWVHTDNKWTGAGQTGHVVGGESPGWWHLSIKKSPGHDPDFYGVYYTDESGEIHVLTKRSGVLVEMSVTHLSQKDAIARKQSGERIKPEINFLPGQVKMVIPGAMDIASAVYTDDPRTIYTKDTVSALYFE